MAALTHEPGAGSLPIEWGAAGTPLEGPDSGDLHLVAKRGGGVLLSVIDGLGHGSLAAEAAREAERILTTHLDASVLELIELCHGGLKGTRGVVMTVATLDVRWGTLEWAGVGNVESVLLHTGCTAPRPSTALILRGGVVGYRLPPLRMSSAVLSPGDLLLFATDGIRSGFSEDVDTSLTAQQIADCILERFGKSSDDALILVVRYLRAEP
jgi:negative regulator of sigma-B (phosphoserine phosphatase)